MYDIIITLILITITLFGFIGHLNLQPDFVVQQLNTSVYNISRNETLQLFNQSTNIKNNCVYGNKTNLTLIVNDTFKLNKYSMNKTFEDTKWVKPIVCWIGNMSLRRN